MYIYICIYIHEYNKYIYEAMTRDPHQDMTPK